MAAQTIRVEGLAELQRDFRRIAKDLAKEVREELRKAAEPVRREAQALFSPVSADSAAAYKVRVRQRGVAVEQSKRRVTGLRPDYGRLQMGRALIPALERKADGVVDDLGEMLDKLADRNGFN
jgi:hypothetical protein